MEKFNLGVWEDFTNQIKKHIQNDNLDNFMRWPIINQTMIAGFDNVEFNELKNSKLWSKWEMNLSENILKPNSCHSFPSSSTNNLHHAYSLNIMMEYFNFELNQFDTVVEFGGGYGNTCRLFKKWGHSGEYYIYDIPELTTIQKHYLSSNSLVDKIKYIQNSEVIENLKGNSLFIGLWSISETPITEREAMLSNLKFYEFQNIFLALGDLFYEENNLEWLNDVVVPKLENLNYTYNLRKIEHGNGMYYFMAKKTI